MARRAGKAASRKARQRKVPRAPRPVAPTPIPPVGTPDAREAASLDPPPRAAVPATASSTLTLREQSEYHYVERDLRNIGILTALMLVLLLAAWAAFSALGLVG